MEKTYSVYAFMKSRTWALTERWYEDLNKDREGVYGTTDEDAVTLLKNQNHDFHLLFCELFREDQPDVEETFKSWIQTMAEDQAHLKTPLPDMIEEFLNVKEQYIELLEEYALHHAQAVALSEFNEWHKQLALALKRIMVTFTENYLSHTAEQLRSRQEMMALLSAPIMKLREGIALLPLVGELDCDRTMIIFTQTLEKCTDLQVRILLIDISGVSEIDKLVADQLYSLISGLRLIGMQVFLSGVRPEIARTSIQLGVQFKDVKVYSSIEKAIATLL